MGCCQSQTSAGLLEGNGEVVAYEHPNKSGQVTPHVMIGPTDGEKTSGVHHRLVNMLEERTNGQNIYIDENLNENSELFNDNYYMDSVDRYNVKYRPREQKVD
jgi:hypothetical protein